MNIIYVYDSIKNRSLKPKKINENNNIQISAIKKCLFGKADPGDTEKLLEEQQKNDRARFKELFGFDIEDIENMENQNFSTVTKRPAKKLKRENSDNQRIARKRRRLFKTSCITNDCKITDFYKVTKCTKENEEKKSKSD